MAVGTLADARDVLDVVLAHAMAHRERRQFVLARQIPDEWLPHLPGVVFVRLSEGDAVRHLEACGSYWVIDRVQRTRNTVSFWLNARCGGTALYYVVSFDGHEWKLGPPGATDDGRGWGPGIGSGFVGRPAECPCVK